MEGSGAPDSAQLVVISAQQYQQRLEQLLALPDAADFAARVSRYAGLTLLAEDHAEQRMALAVEAFHRNAQAIAARTQAVDCTALSSADCGETFIAEFVEPLYQRPLFEPERAVYLELFQALPTAAGQSEAMVTALSSPHFLFRLETRDEQ